MSNVRTSATIRHFGTITATTNKIITQERRAELNFHVTLVGGANPYLLEDAAAGAYRVDKRSVALTPVPRRSNQFTMTVNISLVNIPMKGTDFVNQTVGAVIGAIEQMVVPAPVTQKAPKVSARSGSNSPLGVVLPAFSAQPLRG